MLPSRARTSAVRLAASSTCTVIVVSSFAPSPFGLKAGSDAVAVIVGGVLSTTTSTTAVAVLTPSVAVARSAAGPENPAVSQLAVQPSAGVVSVAIGAHVAPASVDRSNATEMTVPVVEAPTETIPVTTAPAVGAVIVTLTSAAETGLAAASTAETAAMTTRKRRMPRILRARAESWLGRRMVHSAPGRGSGGYPQVSHRVSAGSVRPNDSRVITHTCGSACGKRAGV
jgi:hypothetical protein